MKAIQKKQIVVLLTVCVNYAAIYCLRKPLGVIKANFETDLQVSRAELGWLDLSMLLPYAATQLLAGGLVNKWRPTYTISLSLFFSALSMITFGVWNSVWLHVLLLSLNGVVQAPCWLGCSKILKLSFTKEHLNSVFGFMIISQSAGSLIGTALAVWIMGSYGWRFVYFLLAIGSICIGVMTFTLMTAMAVDDITLPTSDTSKEEILELTVKKRSWLSLWRIPLVPEVVATMFTLKLVRYTLYFWLPMYLLEELNYSEAQAGFISTMFDIGGVIGAPVMGLILDKFFQGKTIIGLFLTMCVGSVCLMFFTMTAHFGFVCNSVFLMIAGTCTQTPDALLAGSVTMSIGERYNRNAGVEITGLANGFGTFGGIVEGPLIGLVSAHWGWSGVFVLIILVFSAGTIVLSIAAYKENVSENTKCTI